MSYIINVFNWWQCVTLFQSFWRKGGGGLSQLRPHSEAQTAGEQRLISASGTGWFRQEEMPPIVRNGSYTVTTTPCLSLDHHSSLLQLLFHILYSHSNTKGGHVLHGASLLPQITWDHFRLVRYTGTKLGYWGIQNASVLKASNASTLRFPLK